VVAEKQAALAGYRLADEIQKWVKGHKSAQLKSQFAMLQAQTWRDKAPLVQTACYYF